MENSLFQKHQDTIRRAVQAVNERTFYAYFPDHPKAYGADAPAEGNKTFEQQLNKGYNDLLQESTGEIEGEEFSPYWNKPLGINYPSNSVDRIISNAQAAFKKWRRVSPAERAGLLVEALEQVGKQFHSIANATMHTTGQSYVMSFQAAGPHAADRALEAVAMGYQELTRFPDTIEWKRDMGRAILQVYKNFNPIPKGVGLVIGCSTFPTWNSTPGIFASLVTGNAVIVKPHPKAVLPIAIYVSTLQHVLNDNGYDPNTIQLAVDSSTAPLTKDLAEHDAVKLVDYTGGPSFGSYIEDLADTDKTVFTEKAGVNPVILHSAKDMREVMRNLAFSVSLYSGQMCTAPQNIYIPETGLIDDGDALSFDDAVSLFKNEVASLSLHPKMGPGILGAIQNENTYKRAKAINTIGGEVVLEAPTVKNQQFDEARTLAPTIISVNAEDTSIYSQELFGPVVLIVKTKDVDQSIALAKDLAENNGAITCAAYTTDNMLADKITDEMNSVFAPVSLNFTGQLFVNQHAAFSDFHVTGGNPAGNASFADPNYINQRFVWVGNREMR